MALSRYAVLDAYTLEELRREYASLKPRRRIRLLQRLRKKGDLSSAIVQWAVDDESAHVRQWIARNVWLLDTQGDKLRNDKDEFVKACLWEGPTFAMSTFALSGQWLTWFTEATHLERLAMMRNARVNDTLVEMVFDPNDTRLGIDKDLRRELALAVLSNQMALTPNLSSYSEFAEAIGAHDAHSYLTLRREASEHYAKLWALAARWPRESGVPFSVYLHVPVDNGTKVRTYQASKEPLFRRAILTNDTPEFDESGERAREPSGVLELGLKDSDEECRQIAQRRNPRRGSPQENESKAMVFFSIGWHSLVNIGMVGLAFASYSSASTQFETVGLSILIVLYATIRGGFSAHAISVRERALATAKLAGRLLELLKDPQYQGEMKETAESQQEIAQTDLKKATRTVLIYSIGWITLLMLAVFKLMTTLVL